jgi:hypothetical protein
MNMATQEDFDFESFKKEAIAGLYAGKKNDRHGWCTSPDDETLS